MTKKSNEEKYKNYRIRKILRYIIILLSLSVIVLSILSLVFKLNIVYALLVFALNAFLVRYRNSIKIK